MSAFDRIVVEFEFTEREVKALARLQSGSKMTESDVEAFDSFLNKQYRALREIRLSELFRRGRERFGEPEPEVATAIEVTVNLDRIEQMLDRVHNHEGWEELLFSPRPRSSAMPRIDDHR